VTLERLWRPFSRRHQSPTVVVIQMMAVGYQRLAWSMFRSNTCGITAASPITIEGT
jgi:hypothetical protein